MLTVPSLPGTELRRIVSWGLGCAWEHADAGSGADPGEGRRGQAPPPSQITITHALFYFYERP